MKRAIFSVCAALVLVINVATPAWATMAERTKYDGKGAAACGNANGFSLTSWIDADVGGSPDDEVRYNANGPGATYLDLLTRPDDPNELESITIDIWKTQMDGTGKVNHWHQKRFGSPGWADDQELFEFAAVPNIDKYRHPWLQVQFDWTDGSCGSKTAWEDNWIP